jgi:hypothetical protein
MDNKNSNNKNCKNSIMNTKLSAALVAASLVLSQAAFAADMKEKTDVTGAQTEQTLGAEKEQNGVATEQTMDAKADHTKKKAAK